MEATSENEEPVSGEVVSVAHALSLPAESYGNDPDIEMAWAMRAMQHAEVYYKKWRPFCLKFDGVIEDFNYGTLLRLDCSQGYTEENTIFAPRIQFLAIEIARNREGHNKAVYASVQDKEEDEGASGGEPEKSDNGGEQEKEAQEGINKSGETPM
ncbi:protein PBDC1 isoform X2 [Phyllostomus discolor]|uniref:Protein PBDC1 isoform X2 n=1 Tax=Phyllostomus discolor TaxID=89673 RepID=A0A7E6CZD2_9CHIR|nr:protein PBDC1 isoform X2 [Phyllostomus discolor]